MKTYAERFRHLLEVWGLTQEELGNLCGIRRGTVGTIVNGKTTPDAEALAELLRRKPDLNPDWLLLGTGPMLRDGKALTPVVTEELQRPAPMQTVPGQIDFTYRYITSMEQQVAAGLEREADQRAQIEELLEMLKKPSGNLTPAAAEPEVAYTPTPRGTIGFQTKSDQTPECVVRKMWPLFSVEVTPQRVAAGE